MKRMKRTIFYSKPLLVVTPIVRLIRVICSLNGTTAEKKIHGPFVLFFDLVALVVGAEDICLKT
jgi:hypothetical protein